MTTGAAWARAGVVVAIVLIIDQTTKAIVRNDVDRGSEDPILPGLEIVHVRNEGVAFGFAAGGKTIVIALIGVALVALILYFARHASKPLIWLPTGLLIGGALGNIVDRVRDGAVTDFLKLPGWPAFNVADIAIVFGVITLAYVLERRDEDPA